MRQLTVYVLTAAVMMSFASLLNASGIEPEAARELPKVLIIGDSVSLGYTPTVVAALEGKAVVQHNKEPDNAGSTQRGIDNIDNWVGETDWDVIHFNWGLWDICRRVKGKRNIEGPISTSPEVFEERLDKLVTRLKRTDAKLMFRFSWIMRLGQRGSPTVSRGREDRGVVKGVPTMLYLGIDLHLKQITVSLRNENGDVVLRRQVSTRWPKLAEFRAQLAQAAAGDEKYVAVVEVCGFHDWLMKWLRRDSRCHMVLVVQPLGRSAVKTDLGHESI